MANLNEDVPPAYDNETVHDTTITPQTCQIDYLAYHLPGTLISNDRTTSSVKASGPGSLDDICSTLEKQATLPPRPTVKIRGVHTDWIYSWGNTRVDFDLQLDVTALIMPTTTNNLTSRKDMNIPGLSDTESLQYWIQRLLNHEIQSIAVERVVTNWDIFMLEKAIRDLIVSTKYKGIVQISFPILHSRFMMTKPDCRMQTSSLVKNYSQKWCFRIAPRPSVAITKGSCISVIQVHWPYASTATPPSSAAKSHPRVFAVQSEISWFNTWKDVILNGVINRKVGWLSLEDCKDVYMDGMHQPMPQKKWGTISDDFSLAWKGVNVRRSKREAPENHCLRNLAL